MKLEAKDLKKVKALNDSIHDVCKNGATKRVAARVRARMNACEYPEIEGELSLDEMIVLLSYGQMSLALRLLNGDPESIGGMLAALEIPESLIVALSLSKEIESISLDLDSPEGNLIAGTLQDMQMDRLAEDIG